MKENDIIERLHKAYDVKTPDVLSNLDFSQVEMAPPPEKNLKKRYVYSVAVYAAACLVVALILPFLIGGGDKPVNPQPQPGVSAVNTEPSDSTHVTTEPPVDNTEILDEFMAALERAIAEGRIADNENLRRELIVELYPSEGAKYGIHVFMANNTASYVYSDGEVYPVPVSLTRIYIHGVDQPKEKTVEFLDIDENGKYDLVLYGEGGSGVTLCQTVYFDSNTKTFTTLYEGAWVSVKVLEEKTEDGSTRYSLYAQFYTADPSDGKYIGELVYENGEIVPKLILDRATIKDAVRAVFGESMNDEPETETEPPVSIDMYPITVLPDETEPPTPAETTTDKRLDPAGTSGTTKKTDPAPKVYGDPADHVRVRFYKDSGMKQEYTSVADIPARARVYYKIETDPGYICTNFSINVYEVGMEAFWDGLDSNYHPYFDTLFSGDKLEYSLTAVLAGDADGNLMYDQTDVDTLNKYLAGDTTTIWMYGHDGYSEKLDYNCDGVINVNDRMQLQSEISTGTADRRAMPYHKYSHDVGTITHLLPFDDYEILPHGRNLNSILTDGVIYNVYDSDASVNELSDEIQAKYSDDFFDSYDLVLVYCYTDGGKMPVIAEELGGIWYTVSRNGAVLNPVYKGNNAGETLSQYAVCIPVSKSMNIQNDYPM